jgi:hypothetical protein
LLSLVVAFGCSSPPEPSTDTTAQAVTWQCDSASIPNGETLECTSEASTASDGQTYACSAGDANCPPPNATTGTNECTSSSSSSSATDSGAGSPPDSGSGSSSSSGDEGSSEPYQCHCQSGKRVCRKTMPTCAGGTHATACGACVDATCTSCEGCGGSSGSSGSSSGSSPSNTGKGCTYTQGYWKNHPSAWPVTSLTIGGVTYTQAQLLSLFGDAPGGDASLILEHQLAAAMLNAAFGASQAQAGTVIADAQAWMAANKDADGQLPYGTSASSPAGAAATAISSKLDTYNNGGLDVPHCK